MVDVDKRDHMDVVGHKADHESTRDHTKSESAVDVDHERDHADAEVMVVHKADHNKSESAVDVDHERDHTDAHKSVDAADHEADRESTRDHAEASD